ncbi:MAG: VanZ family protein [bacterium]
MKKIISLVLFAIVLLSGLYLDVSQITVPDYIDKIYHFTGFSLITILSISVFIAFFDKKGLNIFLIFVLIFGGIISALAEFVQKFTITRSCDVNDWIASLCGIIFVAAFTYFANCKRERKMELLEEKFELY